MIKVILSSVLVVVLSGCSILPSSGTGFSSPADWKVFAKKAEVQLSVVNAEAKSAVYVDRKNIGKTARGGNLSKTFKVVKGSEIEIEFRIKRFKFGHIFRQEQIVRQTLKIEESSAVLCDGKTKLCTATPL